MTPFVIVAAAVVVAGVLLAAGYRLGARRAPRLPHIPAPPPGSDAAKHRKAYVEAVTGPHPVRRTPFGTAHNTSPGMRNLRPHQPRGPQLAAVLRPAIVNDDPLAEPTQRIRIVPGPRAVPSSPELVGDATETMRRVSW